MACQQPPPPPPPPPPLPPLPESSPPAPTTILTIGDDLLLEIFFRLPSLPTLVRAAFACRTFLHAVRSSPTFRPTFHALHPPPLIGLFLTHREGDIPSFAPLRGRADKDIAAVLRGSDFYLTRVPDDQGCWNIRDCRDGYLLLHNEQSGIFAAYSPLARALRRIPSPPTEPLRELYILSNNPEEGSFRLVCVHEDGLQVRAVVFSSHSGEWQVLPWTDAATINKDHPNDDKQCLPPAPTTGKLVNGRVYWARSDYLIMLDTTTLRFSSMELPPTTDGQKPFVVGETKDEELCMVCAIDHRLTVAIWVRKRADGDDIEKWMLDREVALPEIPVFKLAAASRGFLHLHLMARHEPNIVPLCSVFSFCLETPDAELKKIFSLYQYELERSFPYVMPWPSSLACSNKIMNPRLAST